MGTRGKIYLKFNGRTVVLYVHWDAYESGLGVGLARDLCKMLETYKDLGALRDAFEKVKVVRTCDKPTDEDVLKLAPYTDLSVGGGAADWYSLLYKTHGRLSAMLAAGYAFHYDPLIGFGEYRYVVDLDADLLSVNDESPFKITEATAAAIKWSA